MSPFGLNHAVVLTIGATLLFLAILGMLEVGIRRGRRELQNDPSGARAGLGSIESSVFALLGLLVAFTFAGAASRFEGRRLMIVSEANAIGTAWLRLDLLPPPSREDLRALFRQYLDARLATYEAIPDMVKVRAEIQRANALQSSIWTKSLESARSSGDTPATMLLLPALNQMFDISTTRIESTYDHPPWIIFVLLITLALLSALLAGHAMAPAKKHRPTHMIIFAFGLAATNFVILDLEYPRIGIFTVADADRVLYQLRDSMK